MLLENFIPSCSRCNFWISSLGIVICTLFYSSACTGQESHDALPVKTFEVIFDNDLFPSGSDNDYTTGLKFKFTTEPWDLKIPGLLRIKDRFRETNTEMYQYTPPKREYNYRFQGLEVGLIFYTPDSLTLSTVVLGQRPYSSLQYFKMGLRSISKVRHWHLMNISHYKEMNTAFTLGLTGGPAAESLQRWMHEQILKKPEIIPLGWPNQIGKTKNIVVLNYLLDYSQMLNNSRLIPMKTSKVFRLSPRYNIFQWWNVLGGVKLNLGTMMNDVSVYFSINLLNINRQNEHYIEYFQEGFTDLPHGSVGPRYRKSEKLLETIDHLYYSNYTFGFSESVEKILIEHAGLTQDEWVKKIGEIRLHKLDSISLDIESKQRILSEYDQLSTAFLRVKPSKRLNWFKPSKHFYEFYTDVRKKYFNTHSFKIFIKPEGKYVAHNGFLQGPLLYDNSEDHTIRYVQPFVFQLEIGIQWRLGALEIEYKPYIFRSREYPLQYPKQADRVIPIIDNKDDPALIRPQNWHSWSSFVLRINPGIIYERIKRNTAYRYYRVD